MARLLGRVDAIENARGGVNEEYPKTMHHPHEQPAVLSDDYEMGPRPPLRYSARPGQARKFPPVQVMDRNQEAYYAAQGYRVGASQKAAFVPRPVPHSPLPAAPAAMRQSEPELDPALWPTWLFRGERKALARTPQEAAAIETRWDAEDAASQETADAEPAAAPAHPRRPPRRAASAAHHRPNSGFTLRGKLMREAREMGIKPNPKWKIADVRRAIEEQKHEKQGQAA